MRAIATEQDRQAFIEEMGLALEAFGMPRMAGRLLGALLVAEPPEQSADELAATLRASRGSISTTTRLLEAPGLIERVSKPGERKVYWRNRPNAWVAAMERERDGMTGLRELAERGQALMAEADDDARRGIDDTVAFLSFWEREMDHVLERWRRHRRAGAGRAQAASAEGDGASDGADERGRS